MSMYMYPTQCVLHCMLSFAEQLNKIDEDMKKLHEDKLRILRAMQGVRLSDNTTPQPKEDSPPSKGIIFNTIELGTALIYTKS